MTEASVILITDISFAVGVAVVENKDLHVYSEFDCVFAVCGNINIS